MILYFCSSTHVPFEGVLADRKTLTRHSVVTYHSEELPFVAADFSSGEMMKYVYDSKAGRKVTKMWCAYRDAYKDRERVKKPHCNSKGREQEYS